MTMGIDLFEGVDFASDEAEMAPGQPRPTEKKKQSDQEFYDDYARGFGIDEADGPDDEPLTADTDSGQDAEQEQLQSQPASTTIEPDAGEDTYAYRTVMALRAKYIAMAPPGGAVLDAYSKAEIKRIQKASDEATKNQSLGD